MTNHNNNFTGWFWNILKIHRGSSEYITLPQEDTVCSVCYSESNDKCFKCEHITCNSCVDEILKRSRHPVCPLCRTGLREGIHMERICEEERRREEEILREARQHGVMNIPTHNVSRRTIVNSKVITRRSIRR
jgi:hypothetical protein